MSALMTQYGPRFGPQSPQADLPENTSSGGLPVFVECGCCGHLHPKNFEGECRDDSNRFAAGELDEKYGEGQWEEITLEDQMADEE